jgi:hypothetical protein
MSRVGFEPTVTAFERGKTVNALVGAMTFEVVYYAKGGHAIA